MKIELTCPECNSIFRVSTDNSGKQVRCPVCSCISQIPIEGEPITKGKQGESSLPTPISGLPHKIRPTRPRFDQRILLAMVWALGSLVANFVCCGPYVGAVLSFIGLTNAVITKSRYRRHAVFINLITLFISFGLIAFRYLSAWWLG